MSSSQESTRNILLSCTVKNTPIFEIRGNYICKVISCYDGDTVTIAMCPFNDNRVYQFKCRMMHYNSAEIRSKCQEEKDKALFVRDYLRSLICDSIVNITVNGSDKYGRLLIEMYKSTVCINQHMIDMGYGAPYEGIGDKEY